MTNNTPSLAGIRARTRPCTLNAAICLDINVTILTICRFVTLWGTSRNAQHVAAHHVLKHERALNGCVGEYLPHSTPVKVMSVSHDDATFSARLRVFRMESLG